MRYQLNVCVCVSEYSHNGHDRNQFMRPSILHAIDERVVELFPTLNACHHLCTHSSRRFLTRLCDDTTNVFSVWECVCELSEVIIIMYPMAHC